MAFMIHNAKIILSRCKTLFGGLGVPFYSLIIILRYPVAVVIHNAKTVLGRRKPLLGGFGVPLHGLLVILRHVSPVVIHEAQVKLYFRVVIVHPGKRYINNRRRESISCKQQQQDRITTILFIIVILITGKYKPFFLSECKPNPEIEFLSPHFDPFPAQMFLDRRDRHLLCGGICRPQAPHRHRLPRIPQRNAPTYLHRLRRPPSTMHWYQQ